jgi:photosystem II stability/assembly factor-like uncharacterized protein
MDKDLESLYREAQAAMKAREYVRASGLLKQILVIDENYKDASRLLARIVREKRRRWYNDPRLWGTLSLAIMIALGVWLAPKIRGYYLSQIPTPTIKATNTPAPTGTPFPTPTPLPLTWKRIYIGQEFPRDNINVIVFDPQDPDVIYVGTQNAGIYKSIDGGVSWQPAHQGLGGAWVSSLVIDPQNPQTLYAGIALGGVYKSDDGGNNWYPSNNGIDTNGWEWVGALIISPGNNETLYYSQGKNYYLTTDGGDSWTEISSNQDMDCPNQVLSIAIDPVNPDRLFVFNDENPGEETICRNGVYSSSDGGDSWTLNLTIEPIFGLETASVVFDQTGKHLYVSDSSSVYHSNDRGETWQQLQIHDCQTLSVDPRSGDRAYCAGYDKIIMTQDGGANWSDYLSHRGPSFARSITVSPVSGHVVLAGWNGLWRTADEGQSWDQMNRGLGMYRLNLSFDPVDPLAMLLEDEACTVYRSTDGGSHWEPAPDRTCQSNTALNASGEWLFWIDEGDRSLRRSNDKGATSRQMNWPIENESPEIIAAHPIDSDRLLAIYHFQSPPYFFLSDDLGETWREAELIEWDEYSSPGPAPRIFFDQGAGQRTYLIEMVRLYRSDNAGESWQRCANTDSWLGSAQRKAGMIIDPEDADHIILATRGNGILVSTDGCQSWQASNKGLGSPFVNTLALDPNNPDTIYAGTDGGAYVSFDFGQTWNQINDGLLGATVVYSIVVDKDSNVYAATPYGIFKLETR